jgi:hypothetical protein
MSKAVPLRAALGIERNLPIRCLSNRTGSQKQATYYIVIYDSRGFIVHLLLETDSSQECRANEVKREAARLLFPLTFWEINMGAYFKPTRWPVWISSLAALRTAASVK